MSQDCYSTQPNQENEQENHFDYLFDEPGSEPGTLNIEANVKPSQIVVIDYNETRQLGNSI